MMVGSIPCNTLPAYADCRGAVHPALHPQNRPFFPTGFRACMHRTFTLPSPYQPNTNLTPEPLHLRISLAKSEDEAAQVLSWY